MYYNTLIPFTNLLAAIAICELLREVFDGIISFKLLMSIVSDQVVRLQEVAIYKNVSQSLRLVGFISLQTTKFDGCQFEMEISLIMNAYNLDHVILRYSMQNEIIIYLKD